jgi:hypothetical protein
MKLTRQSKPAAATAAEFRAVLREYGLKRWWAAIEMHTAEITVARYLLRPTSKYAKPIPKIRWLAFSHAIARVEADLKHRTEAAIRAAARRMA